MLSEDNFDNIFFLCCKQYRYLIELLYTIPGGKFMQNKPVTAIVVGAGHRAMVYSQLAIDKPELLKIVGVADPNPVRRKMVMEKFGFSEDMCFESAQELATKGKLADAIINGTMDEQHIETAVPLLECGYDMLLEKPFAVDENEALLLKECAKKNN